MPMFTPIVPCPPHHVRSARRAIKASLGEVLATVDTLRIAAMEIADAELLGALDSARRELARAKGGMQP